MKLDRYDIAILNVLQHNGRISKRDLADEIGLSVSPCWVRMRKLEEAGYIRAYEAKVDFDRFARFCHVTTMIKLEAHKANDFSRFESTVDEVPEIVHCEAVIGEVDYIIKCITVDIDHYQRLMEQLLEKDIGIHTYFSHVRSKAIKEDSRQALKCLLSRVARPQRASRKPI